MSTSILRSCGTRVVLPILELPIPPKLAVLHTSQTGSFARRYLNHLNQVWRPLEIDLFATSTPSILHLEARSISRGDRCLLLGWSIGKGFANPPWCLIGRVLAHVLWKAIPHLLCSWSLLKCAGLSGEYSWSEPRAIAILLELSVRGYRSSLIVDVAHCHLVVQFWQH